MSKEITLQEAALAWAQKRKVEAAPKTRGCWIPIRPFGQSPSACYSPDVLFDLSFKFRLAPEPPAKRYRPWTQEEVPVGAVVRSDEQLDEVLMIVGRNAEGVWLSTDEGWYNYRDLLGNMKHSLDNGKTWNVCGVEVSE
jgi:hypothetical protein